MQAILIITSLLCYVFLVLQYKASAGKGIKDLTEALSENALQLLNKRTIVTVPLMIVCVILYSIADRNDFLQFRWNEKSDFLTSLSLCVCLLFSVYSADHIRNIAGTISAKERIIYFSLRIPGLIIYEIFFRGVLLGIFLEWCSMPIAVALNIALYALAHVFGSRKEFIGSIPFGLLLCYLTFSSQSIYPSVLLHMFLALPYESILFTKCQLLTKQS